MIEASLRPKYQKIIVDPAARLLAPYLRPNTVTFLSLLSGVAAAYLIAFGGYWCAFWLLWFSGYLDTLDGTIARMTDRTTPAGSMLDIVCDRAVEFAIILGLFFFDESRALMCLLMLGSVLMVVTTFLVAGIFVPNDGEKSFHYSPGLMERAEAFIMFSLMIFFPDHFTLLAGLFVVLVMYTAGLRLWQVCRNLQ